MRSQNEQSICPIARTLERIGERWSLLIIRDALRGSRRFDDFQQGLDISTNMLTRRLKSLVADGLLLRRRYSERPPRYEYVPSDLTRDLTPVLFSLIAFGNKHFAPEGESVIVVDRQTGEQADPILVDRRTGREMTSAEYHSAYGPAALAHTGPMPNATDLLKEPRS